MSRFARIDSRESPRFALQIAGPSKFSFSSHKKVREAANLRVFVVVVVVVVLLGCFL